MLELFSLLPITYFSILFILLYLKFKKEEKLISTPPNKVNSSIQMTSMEKTERTKFDVSISQPSKPSYKRAHLAIEIPDTPSLQRIRIQEIDYDSIFIREYILANCFPILIFYERNSGLSRIHKFTIWYTAYCIECGLVILFYYKEFFQVQMDVKPILISLMTIMCCCPLSSVLTLMLVRYTEHVVFKVANWIVMGLFMSFILGVAGLGYAFIDEEEENQVILSCCMVIVWEIVILELIKTTIKYMFYIHTRDINCCFSLAQKI